MNTAGTAVANYSYDAWGKQFSNEVPTSSIGKLNPLRYRGYVFDSETGLYYLQNRYYDPESSRFINADSYASTGQGLIGYNMFAYCGNNPIMHYDPTGDIAVIDDLAVIGLGTLCAVMICVLLPPPSARKSIK